MSKTAPPSTVPSGAASDRPAAGAATASKPANSAQTEATTAKAATIGGQPARPVAAPRPKEIGGPKGPEPTRFGDWERDGRCVDF